MENNENGIQTDEEQFIMAGICEIIETLQQTTSDANKEVAIAALGW